MDSATHTALAEARMSDLRAQAGRDRLARLAACCRPSALRTTATRLAGTFGQWLRRGQLQVPLRCCPWPT